MNPTAIIRHIGASRLARVGLGLGLLIGVLPGISPVRAQTTFTILAGAESTDKTGQVYLFLPDSATVAVGDTVTWNLNSTEFHTVTFFSGQPVEPFVIGGENGPVINPTAAFPAGDEDYDGTGVYNSGLLDATGPAQSYSLTFTQPGTYGYICIVHPSMVGTITVVEAGQPVDDQASLDVQAVQQRDVALAQHAYPLAIQAAWGAAVTHDDGTVSEGVSAGSGDGTVALMAFLPGNVTLHPGQSVTWNNAKDPITPHTVTFLAGQPMPEVVQPEPQEGGPPILALNPLVFAPQGEDTFDGTTYTNSGMFGGDIPGATTYTLTFTEPGTYEYVCVLHADMGMKGTITVLPEPTAEGPGFEQPTAPVEG